MPFPDLLDLLDYWAEFPPTHELLRGFVGFKPMTEEQRANASRNDQRAAQRAVGPVVPYEQLPRWLREMHSARKSESGPESGK